MAGLNSQTCNTQGTTTFDYCSRSSFVTFSSLQEAAAAGKQNKASIAKKQLVGSKAKAAVGAKQESSMKPAAKGKKMAGKGSTKISDSDSGTDQQKKRATGVAKKKPDATKKKDTKDTKKKEKASTDAKKSASSDDATSAKPEPEEPAARSSASEMSSDTDQEPLKKSDFLNNKTLSPGMVCCALMFRSLVLVSAAATKDRKIIKFLNFPHTHFYVSMTSLTYPWDDISECHMKREDLLKVFILVKSSAFTGS